MIINLFFVGIIFEFKGKMFSFVKLSLIYGNIWFHNSLLLKLKKKKIKYNNQFKAA